MPDLTASVDQLVLDHLQSAKLPPLAEELVFAAMLGQDELRSALGGVSPPRPEPPAPADSDDADPAGAYLSRIEVRGFRGIGETAAIDLVPGPGLTIVVGRNGSGKSSFAEAAELALTGHNLRWADRTQDWKDGWRNLHVDGDRYVRIGLAIDGRAGGATVECRWAEGAALDDRRSFLQLAGERRGSTADLDWERPLALYRPFLSYSELGRLIGGRPKDMYDSLHSVLGLDRMVELEDQLKGARRECDQVRKLADSELPALREALAAHPDSRARTAEQLLDTDPADLDLLDQLAAGDDTGSDETAAALRAIEALALPERDQMATTVAELQRALRQTTELAETPAAEARTVAGLLRDALRYHAHHPDQPCPVCGGRTLDAQWAQAAGAQAARLMAQAEQLEQAHQAVRMALRRLRELVPPTPVGLPADPGDPTVDPTAVRTAWGNWDDLLRHDDAAQVAGAALDRFDALAAALASLRAAASQALHRHQQAWRPIAGQLGAWVQVALRSRRAGTVYPAARKAVDWLVGVGKQIRNQQLAPLADQATAIWTLLRQDSNVDLGAIRLAGTGPARKVDLSVAVDGEPGTALGVMSQGELHALALSLFLPRATMAASPFRFLVIDDPVQSMDPAKVYGLAQVLDRAAASRQVVVFTHDDRLPTAIRHLQLSARLVVVSRRERSQVSVDVDKLGDPAYRYLDDARAIARDDDVTPSLRATVASSLIRQAIEARCHDLVRVRRMRAGLPHADIEAALGEITTVRQALALVLFDDPHRGGDVGAHLKQHHPRGVRVVGAANTGTHDDLGGITLRDLIYDAGRLIDWLATR
jgi:hypothetical protein